MSTNLPTEAPRAKHAGIRIRRATFVNFRCFSTAEFVLPDHCAVIGANNAGKSALAEGIALALGRDRLVHQVDDYDFHRGFLNVSDPLSARFHIRLLLVGIPHDDPAAKGEWFNWNEGATVRWWDEKEQKLIAAPPDGQPETIGTRYLLASEVGCCGFYDEDDCEYRVIRYFVDGDCDPAAGDPHVPVKQNLLRQLGLFLLPAHRTWDRTLTFSASSFIKLLRENEAVPGSIITELRKALANISPAPETNKEFGQLVDAVTEELRRAGLIPNTANVDYRPTTLDVRSMLTSLAPSVKTENGDRIPLGAQGSGVLALQNLLLLIEFARRRKAEGRNFLFLIEEPELHLFPNLQLRVTQLARGFSTQSIVTTHSPTVASAYSPREVLVIRNDNGRGRSERLLSAPPSPSDKHLTEYYFYEDRSDFLSAVMGSASVLPEGKLDANWLRLLQRLASRHEAGNAIGSVTLSSPSALAFIRTRNSQIGPTLAQMKRLYCDPLVLVDGDGNGRNYAAETAASNHHRIARWADGYEIEDVVAWTLSAGLPEFGPTAAGILGISAVQDCRSLALELRTKAKKDVIRHEELVEAAAGSAPVQERAWQLICDLADLAHGREPGRLSWSLDPTIPSCWVFNEIIP